MKSTGSPDLAVTTSAAKSGAEFNTDHKMASQRFTRVHLIILELTTAIVVPSL